MKLGLKLSDYPGENTHTIQPEFKIRMTPEPGNTVPSHNRFFHHGLANALRQGGPWKTKKNIEYLDDLLEKSHDKP